MDIASKLLTACVMSSMFLGCNGRVGENASGEGGAAPDITVEGTSDAVVAGEIVIDNASTGNTTRTGSWCRSASTYHFGADSLFSCGSSADRFRFTVPSTTSGTYQVLIWWAQYSTRSSSVPVTLSYNGGSITRTFDQRAPGGTWVSFGTYALSGTSYIEISAANGQANADAVKLVPTTSSPPTSPPPNPSCRGPFNIRNEPPVGCMPYPNSLWNKRLPSDVMSHLAPNSDVMVRASFTNDGRGSYPWTRRNSATLGIRDDGKDNGHPLYYGQATDPVYQIVSCRFGSRGIHNAAGVKLHAPSGAAYSGSTGDRHLDIWDQTNNLLFSSYGWGDDTSSPPFPTCPGNGHAGTTADPCPVTIPHYCGISNWTTDPGYGFAAEDSLGNGGYALHPTVNEMKAGVIPHAIYLWQDCGVGSVFPQQGGALECPAGMIRAPRGSLFFLDYTATQLADIKSKVPPYQYALLEAMTKFGGYFGDTATPHYPGPGGPWGFEGANAYLKAGMSYPLFDYLKTFPYDPNNSDPSKPLSCYTYNGRNFCDLGMWVNVPLETGPNCPNQACDVSKHLHIADPCIAKRLAGVEGGCGTIP